MKVAKNMDSVFANCTDDELMFDILFDDDETIIDILAGVDEAGNLVTESYIDEDSFDEADDMVGENPDFEYQNDGDASGSEKDAEGTKEVKPEIGGEVGDGKEVSGKENSAESHADDTKKEEEAIGMNDKQQVKLEDAAEGPIEDDDKAEREGEVSDTAVETEAAYIDFLLSMLESEDPIADGECPNDGDKRAGDTDKVEDIEGVKSEVLGATVKGSAKKEDPIADSECPNDGDKRAGKVDKVEDTEGVETHVVGAALESVDDQAAEEGDPGDTDSPEEGTEECCKESLDISADILAMLEADEEDPIADKDDAEQRAGKADKVEDTEGVESHVVGAALEANDYVDDLLASLDDEDDDDILALAGEPIVPDSVKNNGANNADIEIKEASEADELVDDEDDDADIEAIDKEKIPAEDPNIEYDYDDDELIDAVINGDIDKLDNE